MIIKYIAKDLKDIRITPDIERLIEKKLTQRLKKYSHNNQEQNVTVRVSEKKPRIRVNLETVYLSYRINAEAEVPSGEGILGGVDKCLDILDRQFDKYRTKIYRSVHKNKNLDKTDFAEIDFPADDYDEGRRKIIKVEDYELKPMSIDEAILQLEVLGYKFLFFYNTETGSPGVVYNRDDGNIGLIEG